MCGAGTGYSAVVFGEMFCRSLFVPLYIAVGYCIFSPSSIYGFWLPLWYIETFLKAIKIAVTFLDLSRSVKLNTPSWSFTSMSRSVKLNTPSWSSISFLTNICSKHCHNYSRKQTWNVIVRYCIHFPNGFNFTITWIHEYWHTFFMKIENTHENIDTISL
jgi:hypothetical protein